ncbi:MAG: Ig-like domain-containing protein [Bacilli bacterium]|nr:Ig-like domain-containing protein [Bacilli bacterium]
MNKISYILIGVSILALSACSHNKKQEPEVVVSDDATISLNTDSLGLIVGDVYQLTVTTSEAFPYSFSINDESIASVDNTGKVTALKEGNALIRVFYTAKPSIKAFCSLEVVNASDLRSITINQLNEDHKYNTNFLTTTYSGVRFSYYRVGSIDDTPSDAFAILYPNGDFVDNTPDDRPYLPGALYNDSSLLGLKQITITYSGKGNITYGEDKTLQNSAELEDSNDAYVTKIVTLNGINNFFSINAIDKALMLSSITIKYLTSGSIPSISYTAEGKRILPSRQTSPQEGEVASMPMSGELVDDKYHITSMKSYTYYSTSYVIENELDPEEVSYTSPIDVANYYYLFKSVPPNFGTTSYSFNQQASHGEVLMLDDVLSYFGTYSRQVNTYTRTDGYASSVPYRPHGSYLPLYLEMDIDLSSRYDVSARDVGRLVTWIDGFTGYDDEMPVSTFTGDHYKTFYEYDNMGGWNHPFDGETSDTQRTGYIYSTTTTYSHY